MLRQGDLLLEHYRLQQAPIRSGPVSYALAEPTHRTGVNPASRALGLLAWLWPDDDDASQRLWSARSRLVHRNVAPIIALGTQDGLGVAIEKVSPGETLLQYIIAHGPLDEVHACDVLAQVARALAAANALDLWHGHLVADRIWLLPPDDHNGRNVVLLHGAGLLPRKPPEHALDCDDYDLSAFSSLAVLTTCGIQRWKIWQVEGNIQPPSRMPNGLHEVIRAALDTSPDASIRSAADLAKALDNLRYPTAGSERPNPNAQDEPADGFKSIIRQGDLLEAIVDDVKGPTNDHRGYAYVGFVLRVRDESGQWVQAKSAFWDRANPELFNSLRWAWPGAEISLFDPIRRIHSDDSRSYTGWRQTFAVLEPYWPISVTNTHTAFGCPTRVLVDLRKNDPPSFHLILGNIVHFILEEIVQRPSASFDDLIQESLPHQRLAMLAAGLDDEEVSHIREQASIHFDNLKKFRDGPSQDNGGGGLGTRTEMSRYSGHYGLEGRIDLALESKNGFEIIELKTGRVRDEHLEQVRCYGLLWHELAQTRGHRVTGRVLYSADGSVRPVEVDDVTRQRRVLRYRNELVAMHRALADPSSTYQIPYFEMPGHQRNCYSQACNFRRKTCAEQGELFGERPNLTPEDASQRKLWANVPPDLIQRAWAYYKHQVRLIESEYWLNNAQLGRVLRSDALPDRVNDNQAVAGLRLTTTTQSRVTLVGDHRMLLQVGDEVIAHRGDFARDEIMCGEIVEVTAKHVIMATDAADAAAHFPTEQWIVDKKPFRHGLRAAHCALGGLMRSRDLDRLRLLLTSAQRPVIDAPKDIASLLPFISHLNATQQRAASIALADNPAVLIQGPPGTGKTHVIAALIRAFVSRGQRVLVAAQTNTAVDNVLKSLARGDDKSGQPPFTSFLRVGRMDDAPGDLLDSLRRAGAEPMRCFANTLAKHTPSLHVLRQHVLSTPVIATTTHRAVTHEVFHILRRATPTSSDDPAPPHLFDIVIIDEAGQINEPMTLAAVNLARRFILVGDHRQLPPIVPEEVSAQVHPERWMHGSAVEDIGLAGLDRSLFERLIGKAPHVMLTRQYRMHRQIMQIPSLLFYDGHLEADDSCAHRPLPLSPVQSDALPPGLRAALSPDSPAVFIDCPGENQGRYNPHEVTLVLNLLAALIEGPEPLTPEQIGVISPFRAQVHRIRADAAHRFGDTISKRIDVDTVDRFQGGEREVIIVSLVKTDTVSEFLTDLRRLNVTMTRARSKLILIGYAPNLIEHPVYRRLLTQPNFHWFRWIAEDDAAIDITADRPDPEPLSGTTTLMP
jgi:DNA replication ATP-dependent helicase Dna2